MPVIVNCIVSSPRPNSASNGSAITSRIAVNAISNEINKLAYMSLVTVAISLG